MRLRGRGEKASSVGKADTFSQRRRQKAGRRGADPYRFQNVRVSELIAFGEAEIITVNS
jgi:hypothetical protein